MGKGRRGRDRHEGGAPQHPVVMPLDPVDLLAGLAQGVELQVDDLPAGVAGAAETTPVQVSVNEIGRLLRSEDPTIRRLIRQPGIQPGDAPAGPAAFRRPAGEPDKPGE